MNRWTLLLGSLLLAAPSLPAPAGAQIPPVTARRAAGAGLAPDTAVRVGRLRNGLRYYVRANAEPQKRAELRLVVNAGSVLEEEDQRGLAHVVEHMAFNGTRRFEKQELVDYLERVGMRFGPDINAYTSFDETVYMLQLPTDSAGVLEKGFEILEDWATGVTFDSVEVEKERGVVIEEWRLGQGAAARMQSRQLPVLMQKSRYARRPPIGTHASLAGFKLEALKRFYRDWYRPDLMAVVAVGDFDPARIEALIHQLFGDIPARRGARTRRDYTVPDHRQTLVSVLTDPEWTNSTLSLYLKRKPRPWESPSAYRAWIVESLASSMLTNRLSELTQRPHAPFLDVSSFQGRFIRPLAAYVLSVRVPDAGIERGLDAVLSETERVAQHGFTASELEREKREMMRMMEQRYDEREKTTSSGYAADYVSHFLYGGSLVDLETEFALYRLFVPGVRLEEVNAQARDWMQARNRVVLVNAPQRRDVRVPTEEALRAVIDGVGRKRLLAYDDSVSTAPLISRVPDPAPIVAERTLPGVGVLEWTLANGVRVLLKPTTFREDEVLLAARSPGGSSLLPDSDYVAALTAPAVVQVGGVGELSAIELRKRLAGRLVGVGADINELFETLSGAASPRDLEVLFQLVYLKFTGARLDSSAVLAYQTQARAALQNRSADPATVFQDTLRLTLAQNHPRARPLSSEMIDAMDVGRAFAIYQERFADASDFTFYLVGHFDPDSVRPLVQRYLGTLPSLGRRETARDVGIRPPTGVVEKVVRKGVEPQGRTSIVFTGDLEFSRESLYAMTSLAEVLNLRLREVLREDLSGTYGVEVRSAGWREPRPQFQFSISFGSDPRRLNELTRAVFAQLDTMKIFGPRPDDLVKVREMQLRARQTEMIRNHFWVNQLMIYDRYGWDPREIVDHRAWMGALTQEMVQEAARRYLRSDNYVRVTLVPERTGLAETRDASTPAPPER